MNNFLKLLLIISISILYFSCEKETFNTSSDAQLQFSQDTIIFDTIFTTIGSATKRFTVKNPYKETIKISSIYLAKDNNSPFRINIDGYSGNSLNNVELQGKDSLYIFVEITVDPTGSNLPMVVQDSIILSFNQKEQDIDLIAFGQDVHKINGEIIGTETFLSDKPYLIYDYLFVDTNSTLTIQPGATLHFHRGSRMYVAGTIIANGTFESPIIFEGDRLESIYDDIPGQWDGIWLLPGSKDHIFDFTEIKNAIIGIQVDTLASLTKPTLTINNSKIQNMTAAGIYAQGSTIEGYNNLISNCGQFALALTIGGSYEFNHCTFANYWGFSTRTTPSILLNNYYTDIYNNIQERPLDKATFGNCIIYGNKENEIFLDDIGTTNNPNKKFSIGSNTKLLTAIAIFQLLDKGLLDLDENIKEYIPEFEVQSHKPYDKISIRQILMHRSGLQGDNFHLVFDESKTQRDDLLPAIKESFLCSKPGTMYAYSNFGYGLFGIIIERVSKETYVDYLQKHIFDPLELGIKILPTVKDRMNHKDEISLGFNKKRKVVKEDLTTLLAAGCSTYASLHDMANLLRFFLNPKKQVILSDSSMKQLLDTPCI